MSNVFDCKATQERILYWTKRVIENNRKGVPPCLAIVQVGNDFASEIYLRNKQKVCESVGITVKRMHFDENISEEELIQEIGCLDYDPKVSGIIVQLPLPKHMNQKNIMNCILPEQDVDGLSHGSSFTPCTPDGIMWLLNTNHIDLEGAHAVVIGRSDLVGKPMAKLLIEAGATVTVCNHYTENVGMFTRDADLIICAVGKPKFLTADMVKEGAVVVDVGINRLPDGKVCGDVDFDNVAPKCSHITKVPGGVGLLTTAMVAYHTAVAQGLWSAQRFGL